MPRITATLLIALHAAAQLASGQTMPPNRANSTVPYEIPTDPKYDYAEAMHKSLLFYHAQRSGPLGPNRRLAWRGDSCFDCQGPNGEDLSGGYFEAANTMKWGLPLAWTITQLAFNVHVFSDAMKAVNEYNEALEGVKWGVDYLVNCISSPDQFVGQFGVSAIGDTDIDFGYFGPAEEYEMWAPQDVKRSEGIAYFNSTHRSSEILGESSAALAAASVIFESQDKEWSDKLRDHAIDLFERATKDKGTYMDSNHPNMRTAKEWYPSHGYNDELAWAAAWIYVATGDAQWKTTTDQYIKEAGSNIGEYSWDEKLPGAVLLMYLQTGDEEYKTAVERYISVYRPSGSVKQTAKGLSFHYAWGSLRYASNAGFIMMAYSKRLGYDHADAEWPIQYASQQINYALGDSGRSWVVGFGKDSPLSPYHKSSYNSFIDYPMRGEDSWAQGEDFLFSDTRNRFILYGALEGGPAWDDTFKDDRSAYEFTEVTQDYNAAFTGLNAAMIDFYGHSKFQPFTDCELDLGWSHHNASDPPQWPENDCYHTCNTDCDLSASPEDSDSPDNNTVDTDASGDEGGAQFLSVSSALGCAALISVLALV